MAGLHRRRKRKPTTTDDYSAMMTRMLRAYGKRIGQDPGAGLSHLRQLETELADAVNLGIYTANRIGGHSINQLADMLGVSKQAVHKRVGLGEQVAQMERKANSTPSPTRVARPRELPRGFPVCGECGSEGIGPKTPWCIKHWTPERDPDGAESARELGLLP